MRRIPGRDGRSWLACKAAAEAENDGFR